MYSTTCSRMVRWSFWWLVWRKSIHVWRRYARKKNDFIHFRFHWFWHHSDRSEWFFLEKKHQLPLLVSEGDMTMMRSMSYTKEFHFKFYSFCCKSFTSFMLRPNQPNEPTARPVVSQADWLVKRLLGGHDSRLAAISTQRWRLRRSEHLWCCVSWCADYRNTLKGQQ